MAAILELYGHKLNVIPKPNSHANLVMKLWLLPGLVLPLAIKLSFVHKTQLHITLEHGSELETYIPLHCCLNIHTTIFIG